MKKLFVLFVVLILAVGVAFAQEEDNFYENGFTPTPAQELPRERPIEFFNFEISIGFPIHWTNSIHNDEFYELINMRSGDQMMEDKTVTANTSIGIGLVFNFTRVVGLSLDMDFFYGAKLAGFAAPTSDYIGLSGANIFLGPVFYVFNNNILRVPVGVGFHLYYFTDDLWVPQIDDGEGRWLNRHDLQFGPAVSLAVQFHFSRDIYIFSRTSVAIDLFRTHSIKWYDGSDYYDETHSHFSDISINWLVKPSIGLGIKY